MTTPNWDHWLMLKNAAKRAIEQFAKRTKVKVSGAHGSKEFPTPGPGGFLFSASSPRGAESDRFFIGLDRMRWPLELEHIACTLRFYDELPKKQEEEKMGRAITPTTAAESDDPVEKAKEEKMGAPVTPESKPK